MKMQEVESFFFKSEMPFFVVVMNRLHFKSHFLFMNHLTLMTIAKVLEIFCFLAGYQNLKVGI